MKNKQNYMYEKVNLTTMEIMGCMLDGERFYSENGCEDFGIRSSMVFTDGNEKPFSFNQDFYRRKRLVLIKGIKIPKSESKKPEIGKEYFIPDLASSDYHLALLWSNGKEDKLWLKRGLVHLDRESAIAHAKAMLNIKD